MNSINSSNNDNNRNIALNNLHGIYVNFLLENNDEMKVNILSVDDYIEIEDVFKSISALDAVILDDFPSEKEIVDAIPAKTDIEVVSETPGIFIWPRHQDSDKDKIDISEAKDVAVGHYEEEFADHSSKVLAAITNCAPLVIAAHRKIVEDELGYLLGSQHFSSESLNWLWQITNTDLNAISQRLYNRDFGQLDQDEKRTLKRKIDAIQAIKCFCSPHYSLTPYFEIELNFLREYNIQAYTRAKETLKQVVAKRDHIATLGSTGVKTRKPDQCVKLMAFLVRRVFDKLVPGDRQSISNRFTVADKKSHFNYAPILSLKTWNEKPLTRAHGEVYDAVCTLWVAGNKIITDLMIAKTIWPNTSRHGGETFSQKELDRINELMIDMRLSVVAINATNELHKYKKLNLMDQWVLRSPVIHCSVVYRQINGGKYLQRAYEIIDTPIFYAYSKMLGQVFTVPISVLDLSNGQQARVARTMPIAQVRGFLLGRLHHFLSPSYKKGEMTILFERIYEAYDIPADASIDTRKKMRALARKATQYVLDAFIKAGYISEYSFQKRRGSYHSVLMHR